MTDAKSGPISAAGLEQFAHGKLIEGNRDLRGFTVVARSPGAPSDDWIHRIRAQANVGTAEELESYAGSDVAFALGPYVVAGRFQCSPRRYDRGYFPQEHYLVLSRNLFPQLGCNYAYLLALLPPSIPWRSRDELLPTLPLPARTPADETQRVQQVLDQYGDHVFHTLHLALTGQPFAVVPPRDTAGSIVAFLETLGLLLPPGGRVLLSWAINVLDVQRCAARVKVVWGGAAGTAGVTFVRLGMTPANPPWHLYVMKVRKYQELFGVSALLQAVEASPVPPDTPWEDLARRLEEVAQYRLDPAILEHDLPAYQRHYPKVLYDNRLLPMLDNPAYPITPVQRSQFLLAVVDGVLEGVLQVTEANRVPRDVLNEPTDALLWPGLAQALAARGVEPADSARWTVLAAWRANGPFWSLPSVQTLVQQIISREVEARATQPEQALLYLRQMAISQLTPDSMEAQIDLLNRAISRASVQAGYRTDTLVLAWMEMATQANAALQVAQKVPPLWVALNSPAYSYILQGLSQAAPPEIDQLLAHKTPAELEAAAELLLAAAWLGERLSLPGFRSARILYALSRQASRLSADRLNSLVDALDRTPTALSPEAAVVLADLFLSVGQAQRFKAWLLRDWRWIDALVAWLGWQTSLTPASQSAVNLAVEWFRQYCPPGLPSNERNRRLRQVFLHWTRLTRRDPTAINDLTLLLLYDAFRGESRTEARGSLVNWVVEGLRFVHEHLFPEGITTQAQDEAYRSRLFEAFNTAWKDTRLTGKLIKELSRARLDYEARWLGDLNYQQRGQEILRNLWALDLKWLSDLENLLTEASEMTPEQFQTLIPEPQKRVSLKQRCQQARDLLASSMRSLHKLQGNIH